MSKLPLASGTKIVVQTRSCDGGASAYCALELVVTGARYPTSAALVKEEHALLLKRGWTGGNADTGDERAADSPGHKLRVTYATAFGELKDIDYVWVKRSRATALALARALFARSSTMALLLEVGAS